jgi:hypothetical protein
MVKGLAKDSFVGGRTKIDFRGEEVLLRKKISSICPGSKILISFEGYSTEVEQALCLARTHGSFKLEGERCPCRKLYPCR